ncbi:MAG: MFS transporter [Candidatus Abyssobacteria bacterium SURF_5]|uniref:MFS transporter n=1 Tax=Abyssobacteria bacterium (strain SURF_5) TaxID=2093360 RepID=A0A3A4P4A1_ABYX5|nr:MAG: MFS transporter [Candidatus Abyssubacteria bacterium SURF_5]
MSHSISPQKTGRVFFGWYIVCAGFICLWINAGIGFYSFPVFLVELTNKLGWGRGSTAVGISITFIIGGFASPVVGRLLPNLGPKKLIIAGSILMSLAFIAFSFMTALWQFYLICSFLAIGLSCTGTMPASYVISDWFQRKRGRAMGIMMIGVGLGGLTFVPLTNRLIQSLELRQTFIAYGLFISLAIVPITSIIIRRRPAEAGVMPDGDLEAVARTSGSDSSSPAAPVSWKLKEALRTKTFWAIAAAFLLATFGQTPILIHQVAYFQDIGISAEKAAAALGLCAFLGIGGKLFFGAMADRYPARYAMMLCFGLQFVGTLLLLKTGGLGSPYWFVIVWGFAMGGVIALEPLIVVECFGMESFGVILGMLYVLTTIGGSSGAPFAGFIFDFFKSYNAAFVLFAVTYLFATAFSLLAVPPCKISIRPTIL